MTTQEQIKELRSKISELMETTSSPEIAVEMSKDLLNKRVEVLRTFYLNVKNDVICTKDMVGTINQCVIYHREIAREALLCDAVSVIILHNHPSGKTEPSTSDIKMSGIVKDSLSLFNIKLIDSIIVGIDQGYFSMLEKDLI